MLSRPGAIAFTIDLDPATGAVSLEQDRAVVHDDPADPVETGASAAVLAARDLITLTATITDGDGDTDSATATSPAPSPFEDDGPTIDAATGGGSDPGDRRHRHAERRCGPGRALPALFNAALRHADGFKDSDDNDVEDADAHRV